MIRHFVFFTAQDADNIDTVRKGLQILTQIPHAQHLEIALNRKSDPASKEVDVVVYGEFADDAAQGGQHVFGPVRADQRMRGIETQFPTCKVIAQQDKGGLTRGAGGPFLSRDHRAK